MAGCDNSIDDFARYYFRLFYFSRWRWSCGTMWSTIKADMLPQIKVMMSTTDPSTAGICPYSGDLEWESNRYICRLMWIPFLQNGWIDVRWTTTIFYFRRIISYLQDSAIEYFFQSFDRSRVIYFTVHSTLTPSFCVLIRFYHEPHYGRRW